MVTRADDGPDKAVKLRGKSTDTNPTDVPNGSSFLEIDTSNVYCFDADDEQWRQL